MEKNKMTDKCRHLQEYDFGRYAAKCIITNDTCTTAIDRSGELSGYVHNAAAYCPAFNLEGELAKSLQKLHLDKQRMELTNMLSLNEWKKN